MKTLILLVAFSAALLPANSQTLFIENTHLSFAKNSGQIEIPKGEVGQANNILQFKDILFEVHQVEEDLWVFNDKFKLTLAHFNLFKSFEAAYIERLNFEKSNQHLLFSFASGSLIDEESDIAVTNFYLSCIGGNQKIDPTLAFCLHRGRLIVNSISLKERFQKVILDKFATSLAPLIANKVESNKIDLDKLKDIKLRLNQGKLTGDLKFKMLVNLKLKLGADVDYVNDDLGERFIFQLTKAKVGFISIRTKILEAIKDAEIENIEVKGKLIILKV